MENKEVRNQSLYLIKTIAIFRRKIDWMGNNILGEQNILFEGVFMDISNKEIEEKREAAMVRFMAARARKQ